MQENIVFKNWLKHRQISNSIIEEFSIHWGTNAIFGECIVIPVLDSKGEFSFNKYRRNPMVDAKPKYLYDKGGRITLYGLFKAQKEKSILITEGEMDCLVAWSANIPSVTSTGGSNSFQEEWAKLLKDKEITICFDNDESGGTGMVKILKFLPHAYIVFLPDRPGIKDISDYVANGGDLTELIRTRVHFTCLQDVIDDRSKRLSIWQSTWFHDAYIKEHTKPIYVQSEWKGSNDGDAIARAKQYPIGNLIKFDRMSKALCIWHSENSPSLHYYKDTNTVYCFGGCGKHGDSIDVYRQLHNCSFKEAIKNLT